MMITVKPTQRIAAGMLSLAMSFAPMAADANRFGSSSGKATSLGKATGSVALAAKSSRVAQVSKGAGSLSTGKSARATTSSGAGNTISTTPTAASFGNTTSVRVTTPRGQSRGISAPKQSPKTPAYERHNGHHTLGNQKAHVGLYDHLKDHWSVNKGKAFTQRQKQRILDANRSRNPWGDLRDDITGEKLRRAEQHRKGVRPPSNESQVDHILARTKGGANSARNAAVRARHHNIAKSDK